MGTFGRNARARITASWLARVAASSLSIAVAGSAAAQPAPATTGAPAGAPPECDFGYRREVGTHRFLYPMFVPSALVTSHIGTRTGLAVHEIPNVAIDGSGSADIKQVQIAEAVVLGVRLFDRLGLFASLRGSAAASTEVRSLVVHSGEYVIDGDAGVIVKLFELPGVHTQLSLRGRIGAATGKMVSLLPLLQALERNPQITLTSILQNGIAQVLLTPMSSRRWGADVALAQPILALLSLQAAFGLTVEDAKLEAFDVEQGSRSDLDSGTVRPELGAAATLDFAPLGIPFASMVEYRLVLPDTDHETLQSETEATVHLLAVGLYYSGRSDLQVGLVGVREWGRSSMTGRVSSTSRPRRLGGLLALQYFW